MYTLNEPVSSSTHKHLYHDNSCIVIMTIQTARSPNGTHSDHTTLPITGCNTPPTHVYSDRSSIVVMTVVIARSHNHTCSDHSTLPMTLMATHRRHISTMMTVMIALSPYHAYSDHRTPIATCHQHMYFMITVVPTMAIKMLMTIAQLPAFNDSDSITLPEYKTRKTITHSPYMFSKTTVVSTISR